MKTRIGLGRGLDALIDTSHVDTNGSSSISEVELSKIVPNPNQPRRTFDEEALQELAASIREMGVISPITLRKNEDDTYSIIAGERRYRAAKLACLTAIPAYIRTVGDEQAMEMALVENIQREDLDAIETALAYQRLMDEYQLTQERMSERVGKKRTTIANYLRLLKLPAEIQLGIKERKIDMGHARALLAADTASSQLGIYKRILAEGLSVRKVEELAAGTKTPAKSGGKVSKVSAYQQEEERLARALQTAVHIQPAGKQKSRIVIEAKTEEDLQRLIDSLTKQE